MANSPIIYGPNGATSLVPGGVTLPASTSGTLQIQPASTTTSYTLTAPNAVPGTAGSILTSDTSGNLSFTSSLPPANGGTGLTSAGSDGQLLKSMNSAFINSSYYTNTINYVGNAFAETNTNGWVTYSDTASNIPVDGTGGTATGLTFSRTTSTPLRGSACFSMVQANSTSLQGKGVSYDFNIDPADQAKALSIQLDYNASSTFVVSNGITPPLNDGTTSTNAGNSDLEIFIFDKTNSLLIPVSPQVFLGNGSTNFTFKGIFQTASNSTSYRLIIHCATTSANATGWTFKFTNVYVGPQPIVQGPPVIDFTTYPLTIGGTTSAPTPGTTAVNQAQWARCGDHMIIKYQFNQTGAGSAGNGVYLFPIPFGSIDSTKTEFISTNGNRVVTVNLGYASVFDGTTVSQGSVVAYNSTNLALYVGTAFNAVSNSSFALSNATIRYGFTAIVPITGWSSSTLMSNDASTRVVAAQYYESTQHAASTTQPINYDTQVYDTHGAVTTGSSWKFTAPVSGFYRVYGVQNLASANTSNVNLYKNGSLYTAGMAYVTNTQEAAFCMGVQLNAGEFIDIRTSSSVNTNTTSRASFINIEQILGPSNIAALDSINARYYASSTSISSSLATVVWTTKDYDSTNSMSSGIYTCPVSGKYSVTASLAISGTFALNNTTIIEIQKNGTAVKNITHYIAAVITNDYVEIHDDGINCLAGDQIRIQVSNSGTSPAIVASNTRNVFSIFKSGN